MKSYLVVFVVWTFGLILLTNATIDYSTLDLANFRYFKHFPMIDYAKSNLLEPIGQHFEKKKAILTYLQNMFFGNPLHNEEMRIEFDPNFGEAWKPHYEHYYGNKGKRLVDLFGRGYAPEELQNHGPIPKDFGEYYE